MKRSERLYPENLITQDFQEFKKTVAYSNLEKLVSIQLGNPEAYIKHIYSHAWWDGRASQFNLRPTEAIKDYKKITE